jgi:hypothetical protein
VPILERAWDELRRQQFTIVTEDELGVPGVRREILRRVYTPAVMEPVPDLAGPVKDRYRIKDMAHYTRGAGEYVSLRETSQDRFARLGTGAGVRSCPRFRWLDVPGAAPLTQALLNTVPPEQRHPAGVFGVHAVRSFTHVVDGPHQDLFEWGMAYVLDMKGSGARSYLYRLPDREQVLDHQLQPGEILLFLDACFLHGATALEDGCRDALIMQFEAPEDIEAAREEMALLA